MNGFNKRKEHSDLWIPTAIGFLERVFYPVLIGIGYFVVVSAWIGIKTAGSWMGYLTDGIIRNAGLILD